MSLKGKEVEEGGGDDSITISVDDPRTQPLGRKGGPVLEHVFRGEVTLGGEISS